MFYTFDFRSFKTGKCQIFEWILLVDDPKIVQYCLEADKEDGVSLCHLATSADSPAALKLLLKHFSLSEVVNSRQTVDYNNYVTPCIFTCTLSWTCKSHQIIN